MLPRFTMRVSTPSLTFILGSKLRRNAVCIVHACGSKRSAVPKMVTMSSLGRSVQSDACTTAPIFMVLEGKSEYDSIRRGFRRFGCQKGIE